MALAFARPTRVSRIVVNRGKMQQLVNFVSRLGAAHPLQTNSPIAVMNKNLFPAMPAQVSQQERPVWRSHRRGGERAGHTVGIGNAIVTILRARAIRMSAGQLERIVRCPSQPQLNQWLARAVTAVSVNDVFQDTPRVNDEQRIRCLALRARAGE